MADALMKALWAHTMRRAHCSLRILLKKIMDSELRMRLDIWRTQWCLSLPYSRVVSSGLMQRSVGSPGSPLSLSSIQPRWAASSSYGDDNMDNYGYGAYGALSREEKLARAAVRWTLSEMEKEVNMRLAMIDCERDEYLGAAMECIMDEAADHAMAIQVPTLPYWTIVLCLAFETGLNCECRLCLPSFLPTGMQERNRGRPSARHGGTRGSAILPRGFPSDGD